MRPDIINTIYILFMVPLWIISELVHGLTDSIYLIPVVSIFVITVLFHKMNWKKCGILFVLTSVICAYIYYSINIKEHMPPETALGMEVFSKCVLRSSIRMSFYTLLNLILWRFITAFYHRMSERYHVIAKKRVFAGFFAFAYALFIIMYINIIYKFEGSILDPMITEVFNNIPYLWVMV